MMPLVTTKGVLGSGDSGRRRWGTRRRRSVALGASLLLVAPGVASADPDPLDPTRLPPPVIYNYGENETTRSAAMGGALRALGNGTSAVFLNPADMVETRVYHAGTLAQITPETRRYIFGGTVVDSVTGRLAGAISMMGGWIDSGGLNRTLIDVRVALAYPLSDRIFLGLGGRYVKITQSAVNAPFSCDYVAGGLVAPSTDAASSGASSDAAPSPCPRSMDAEDADSSRYSFVNAITFDAGLTVKAADSVYIAVVGQNLTYPNHGLLPTTVGGGIGLGNRSLSLEVDALVDLTSWGKAKARAMIGGEYLIGDHVPVRLGYQFDQGAKLHTLSTGVGYIGTEFSVEAGLKRTLSNPGATTVLFSLEYFFEASGLIRAPAASSAELQ
jgi:hypothetical protein